MINAPVTKLDSPEKELACQILEQAVSDYKALQKNKVTKLKDRYGVFTAEELETFFGSTWCEYLLYTLKIGLSGKDVMSKIVAMV